MDEDPGRELEEFLRTLGFRHAGHHRSKSVDLFRQGRANLVLNADPDSAGGVFPASRTIGLRDRPAGR